MKNKFLRLKQLLMITSLIAVAPSINAQTNHETANGAIFSFDISYPFLGEAYQDPAGMVWGDIVSNNGTSVLMDFLSAKTYCQSYGAFLPSRNEWSTFSEYLTKYGQLYPAYTPLTKDGNDTVLPNLDKNYFWVTEPKYGQVYTVFNGKNGVFEYSSEKDAKLPVRCVVGKSGPANIGPLMISKEIISVNSPCASLEATCDALVGGSSCNDQVKTFKGWRSPTIQELYKFVGIKSATTSYIMSRSCQNTTVCTKYGSDNDTSILPRDLMRLTDASREIESFNILKPYEKHVYRCVRQKQLTCIKNPS